MQLERATEVLGAPSVPTAPVIVKRRMPRLGHSLWRRIFCTVCVSQWFKRAEPRPLVVQPMRHRPTLPLGNVLQELTAEPRYWCACPSIDSHADLVWGG